MRALIILMLLFSTTAHALEAQVVVLQAPMFKDKSLDSPVVQYLRKGEFIKLHSALGNSTKYDYLSPSKEKFRKLKEKLDALPERQDPLFAPNQEQLAYLEDEFLPTVDRLGNIAYVLSEHVYVYFGDAREFSQKVPTRDPTDYRLEEPLPKNYPLDTITGLRGQFLLGFSQPYNESYAYPGPVKTKGYSNPAELYLALLKQVPYDLRDRFYYGGSFSFRYFENNYSFFDFRSSKERYVQLSLGPLLTFDAYRGEKNRLNLSFAINFVPLNSLSIRQEREDFSDTRTYRAFGFSSRFGIQYHRKEITNELDFVLGTFLDFTPPTTFQAQDAGARREWWQTIGGDKFRTRSVFTVTGMLGLQAAY